MTDEDTVGTYVEDSKRTRSRNELLDLADFHRTTYGTEEIDLANWLDGDEILDDPIRLAYLADLMADTKSLASLAEGAIKRRLSSVLDGAAVRVGDVVYVDGAGSGKWSPTPELWTWLVKTFGEGVLDRYLKAIVSGIRVTAIDKIAEEAGLGSGADEEEREKSAHRTVRDSFLNYKPGTPGLQRKDLNVENVRKAAAKWWPEADGQITEREEKKDG